MLKVCFGLTPFCVRDPIGGKGEWDFWYISLFQLSLDRKYVIIYSFDIIFKFLAFRLKSGILPYAAEIISSYLLEPVVVLLTKFSWQAEFQLKAGI